MEKYFEIEETIEPINETVNIEKTLVLTKDDAYAILLELFEQNPTDENWTLLQYRKAILKDITEPEKISALIASLED